MWLHLPPRFRRAEHPMAWDFLFWLALLIGTVLTFALGPGSLF